MLIVDVNFTAGRFHATPWGRHVNEGVVEWPPSPWRLLRALVATWKRTFFAVPAEEMSPLLLALAAPPEFRLPAAAVSHVRHYMPEGDRRRVKVFDTFVAVAPHQPVRFVWPNVSLEGAQLALLEGVLSRVPYFGRAESWCAMSLGNPPDLSTYDEPGYTKAQLETNDGDTESVMVLAADPWPVGHLIGPRHPLMIDMSTLRDELRRRDPPGASWLVYQRSRRALTPRAGGSGSLRLPHERVHVMRFGLESKPLPDITQAIAVGEGFRSAAMSRYGGKEKRQSIILSGHRPDGERASGHEHARFVPTAEERDRRQISHVTVVAKGGLDPEEQAALRKVEWIRAGEASISTVYLGAATLDEAAKTSISPFFGPSTRWVSSTPYVLSRHPRGKTDSPTAQVSRELEFLFPGKRVRVRELGLDEIRRPRWSEFRRWRSHGPQPALAQGFGFELIFDEPVRGPIAIGYASHYGLGVFLPVGG